MIEGPLRLAYAGAAGAVATGAHALSWLPFAPARWRRFRDRLAGLDEREAALLRAGPVLWLHAASVGELHAARPLLGRLRQRYPERVQLVTTMTRTGLAAASEVPSVNVARLLPIDAPGVVREFIAQFRLDAFLFTETEIWPSLLRALADREIPAVMVSGRSRPRNVLQRRLLRTLYRSTLRNVTCCMQSDADAARMIELGADPQRVVVTGSLKFDAAAVAVPPAVRRLGERLGAGRPCLVAGSTHEGEEAPLLDAFARLRSAHADLVLILAPRHPERLAAVGLELDRRGVAWERFSELTAAETTAPVPGARVVLLDVMGPLAACYTLATVAFVGGTLVPIGGHNLLEPARAGRPLVVGPHTAHVQSVLDPLLAARAAFQADSADALCATLLRLFEDPAETVVMGEQARMIANAGQGSLDRHMKVIAARLGVAVRELAEFG